MRKPIAVGGEHGNRHRRADAADADGPVDDAASSYPAGVGVATALLGAVALAGVDVLKDRRRARSAR